MTYTLRRADITDTPTVVALLTERTQWLRRIGSDQWSEKDPTRDTEASIRAGSTWLLVDQMDSPVATITMTTTADLDFWTPAELGTPALYLSKLATRTDLAGQRIGIMLGRAAWQYANQRGIRTLRWDVWRTNQQLQDYYAREWDATHIRTVTLPTRRSGALFEWRYRAVFPRAEETIQTPDIEAPAGIMAELPSRFTRRTVHLGEEAEPSWDPPAPAHWHFTQTLAAPNLYGSVQTAPQPLTVAPGTDGTLLFHAGDTWRAHAFWSYPVTGAVLDQLTIGQPYTIRHHRYNDGRCGVVIVGDMLHGQPRVAPIAGELVPA